MLFSIFLFDIFFLISEADSPSYANDNTLHAPFDNVDDVIKILENDDIRLFKWFSDNKMKANKDECHLFVRNNVYISIKIDDIEVENSDCGKVLGIKIVSKLSYKDHLEGVRSSQLVKIFKGLEHTEVSKFQIGVGFLGVLVTF